MGHSADKRFEFRFTKGIEVVYRARPMDGEERQLNQQKQLRQLHVLRQNQQKLKVQSVE